MHLKNYLPDSCRKIDQLAKVIGYRVRLSQPEWIVPRIGINLNLESVVSTKSSQFVEGSKSRNRRLAFRKSSSSVVFLLLSLSSIFFSISNASNANAAETATKLYGTVSDKDGVAIPNVGIAVTGPEGFTKALTTDAQGNWDLASAFNAGISLQMGLSLKSTDLKKIKKEKEIAKILNDLKSSYTFDDLQKDDGVELQTNSGTIESKEDLFKIKQLSNPLEKLSQLLITIDIDHYVAWFEDGFSNSSGNLDGNLLYPVVYADAFWTEDGVQHQLHVTHTEIFQNSM